MPKNKTIAVIGRSERLFRSWTEKVGKKDFGDDCNFIRISEKSDALGRGFDEVSLGYDYDKAEPAAYYYAVMRKR